MMSQKHKNMCKKSFYKVQGKNLSFAVKLNVIMTQWNRTPNHILQVPDLEESIVQLILENKDQIKERLKHNSFKCFKITQG